MSESKNVSRRDFLNQSLAAAGAAGVAGIGAESVAGAAQADAKAATPSPSTDDEAIPCGRIGNAKISRLLLGGNLISGYMHARDLKYVNPLFRAYANEEKILETLKVAEEHGVNTVFESGANFIERYNRECGGHMQFIPHIRVDAGQSESSLKEHIQKQVDSGAVALYVWGVAADRLVQAGAVDSIGKAVELAKKHDLPVGVGGHSLLVPVACEKHQVPCDFYVKTLHSDDYPSATPKESRKEFVWLDGGEGWYDNMWCINPEETIEFMKNVTKPWLAFKVLAAGAFYPRDGFKYAFKGGADFIAVGMFDFQIDQNCEQVRKEIRRAQDRERPWRA
ncbi:MAG: twin-arginine translocation signal domain-containing protein [Planctomycetes bacterium]|nr:twin-arginine translocation signal domain-containing protein [Planctomycetota bacterium]MBL7041000.1 twin-arginine translocation signal domain-containing protein [Pirellulaceae bacterium]